MNDGSKPLISVIIPTRERSETLFYTLQTVLDQQSPNIEAIVSDNFSQDNTATVVKSLRDSRIRYFNTGRRLSMCDNWEFAIERACGEYVIFIGDDDAILPGALDRLELLIRARSCPVYCWPTPVYSWPMYGQESNIIYLPSPGKRHEIDLHKLARMVITMGGARYSTMPCFYHSAVARLIADKIRERTGRIFHSTQPDVFTTFALPVFSARALETGFYVTVHGVSAKSNGGIQVSQRNQKNIEKFIQEYDDYKIHPTLLPHTPLIANLIIDCMLVAMEKFPEFYAGIRFNYSAMWAFVRRLRWTYGYDLGLWQVVRDRRQIQSYQPFNLGTFLLFSALLELAAVWRKLLRRIKLSTPSLHPGATVADFVQELSQISSTPGLE